MALALLGALGSIGAGAAGGAAANAAQQGSAETQAYISDLQTNLQKELFEDQVRRQQPYLDFGYGGVNALKGGIDFRATPEYAYRQSLGEEAINSLSQFDPSVLNYARKEYGTGLDLSERDDAYSKIIDRIKIGQGQAASAGQGAQSYGTALANAYQRAGSANALSNMYSGNAQQNMMNRGMAQASSVPSYLMQQNYLRSLNTGTNPYVSSQNPLGLTPGQGL